MKFSFAKEKINFKSRRSMHLKLRAQNQLTHLIWDGGSIFPIIILILMGSNLDMNN